MTEVRVLVQFGTFRVQKWYSDEIYRWFCIILAGEAQKSHYFDQKLLYLIKILKLFVKITCFLSFSKQNHAESSRNFVKNLVLDPKRAKFDQKSWFGHVRTCPGGQVLTANQRKYFYFFRFYTFPFFISKFIIFYKIIGFTKQIDHFLYNHRFY